MTAVPAASAGATADNPGAPGTLLFENERVRVWELVMLPGEVCNWHVHDYDHLLMVIDGAYIEARRADGSETSREIRDGTTLFIPASPIAEIARNASPDRTLRELIVDLKDKTVQASAFGMLEFFRPGTATTSRTGTLASPGSAP